jgi:hypothetical protein
MSSNTANTLNAIKGVNSTFTGQPTGTSTRYRLTERHKAGIEKMIWHFDSYHSVFKKFEVHIGFREDGHTPHLITLEGLAIVKHLNGVLEFEAYGEDGRDILNGIRECYSNDRFQMNIKD